MFRPKRKGRQHVKSKKTIVDGIKFQSGLEAYTYRKLKEAGIPAEYEERQFVLIEGFMPNSDSWEFKYKKFVPRCKKVAPITYKPDFTCPNMSWVIECKGRANELFPMHWKLFKRHLKMTDQTPELYMPHSQKDVDVMIESIIENR